MGRLTHLQLDLGVAGEPQPLERRDLFLHSFPTLATVAPWIREQREHAGTGDADVKAQGGGSDGGEEVEEDMAAMRRPRRGGS